VLQRTDNGFSGETEIETVDENPPKIDSPVEETKQSPTEQGLAADQFFVLLGKPKAFQNSAGSWAKQIQPPLATVPLDRMKAIMEFAVSENDFSAEYLRLAKDPMASFVKNFEDLERRYEAREAALKAKVKIAGKLKSVGEVIKQAPGAHGNKDVKETKFL
jgi:hypothetical protein